MNLCYKAFDLRCFAKRHPNAVTFSTKSSASSSSTSFTQGHGHADNSGMRSDFAPGRLHPTAPLVPHCPARELLAPSVFSLTPSLSEEQAIRSGRGFDTAGRGQNKSPTREPRGLFFRFCALAPFATPYDPAGSTRGEFQHACRAWKQNSLYVK